MLEHYSARRKPEYYQMCLEVASKEEWLQWLKDFFDPDKNDLGTGITEIVLREWYQAVSDELTPEIPFEEVIELVNSALAVSNETMYDPTFPDGDQRPLIFYKEAFSEN